MVESLQTGISGYQSLVMSLLGIFGMLLRIRGRQYLELGLLNFELEAIISSNSKLLKIIIYGYQRSC